MIKQKIKTAVSLMKKGQFDLAWYKLLKLLGFKEVVPPLPHWLIVEPANFCNLKCPTCPTGAGKLNRPPRAMTFEEFKNIVDQVKGYVRKIVLFNYGEPFLNKEIVPMMEYAVKNNIFVKISTNGEFFQSPDFCRRVIQTGVQYLIIALDGAGQETISQSRPRSNFDNIIQGCRNIVAAKKKYGTEKQKVELQFIIMRHNEHQKDKMKKLAKEIGFDLFKEKSVGINVNDSDFQELARKYVPKKDALNRYQIDKNGNYFLKGSVPNFCRIVYSSLTINSDGSVVPCCYDVYSEHIMGNAFEEPIKKIWHSEKYNNFRKAIKANRAAINICNICPEGRIEKVVRFV